MPNALPAPVKRGKSRQIVAKEKPVLAQNLPQGRGRLVIFASRPYGRGHGDDSLGRCVPLRVSLSPSRDPRTQGCRSLASIGHFAPATPRSTSTVVPGRLLWMLPYRIWPVCTENLIRASLGNIGGGDRQGPAAR